MRYLVISGLAIAMSLVWWMSRWTTVGVATQRDTAAASSARSARAPELPDMPGIDREAAREAFFAAQARGSREPGMEAFRDHTDRYLAHNTELVGEHARLERLTVAEVSRLTHFAMVVARMQDWSAVAAVLGAPVPRAVQREVSADVRGASEEMKHRLREHVAAGDGEGVRAVTIDRIEREMFARYFELTGMTPAKLDLLLANALFGDPLEDVAQEGAPAEAAPLGEGEVAEVVDEPEPDKHIYRIERVELPKGAALAELEAAAGRDPRLAAEIEAERRRR